MSTTSHDAKEMIQDKPLKIGQYEFQSRLIVGTGKYETFELMEQALAESGTELVTVAIRRVNLDEKSGKTLMDFIDTS